MSFRYGRKSCRFQVLSDLHLEVGQQYNHFNLRAKAPNLILAGDIGRLIDYDGYLAFLTRQSKQFERVFLVLGNHEFYGTSRAEGLRKAQQLVKESSVSGEVHLLERTIYNLTDSDVIVLGCTLHSFITPEQRDMVHYRIQDFQKIQDWTIDEHNSQHEQDVMWLRDQITTIQQRKNGGNKRILIATHHAPAVIGTSRPEHSKNEWNSAFSTDLIGNSEFTEFSKIHWWIYGHTHYTTLLKVGNVKVMSNQRGYVLPKAPYIVKEKRRCFSMVRQIWTRVVNRNQIFSLEKCIKV